MPSITRLATVCKANHFLSVASLASSAPGRSSGPACSPLLCPFSVYPEARAVRALRSCLRVCRSLLPSVRMGDASRP